LEKRTRAKSSSDCVNRVPVCTGPDLAVGAGHCDVRRIFRKHPNSSRPRCSCRGSGATAGMQIRLSFFGHSCATSRDRPRLCAARSARVCAACDSSFSFARQISRFGIASSHRVAARFQAGQRLKRLHKKGPTSFAIPSEARNLSFIFIGLNRREIPRFARNDKINNSFRSLKSGIDCKSFTARLKPCTTKIR
jgi:hypothetical protein